MLEDAAGIRRVVLACGTVDLRKASMAWQRLSAINTDKIRLKRELSFYFAGNVLIDAKDSYGWAQEFCFFINDSKQGGYPGQEIYKRLQNLRKNNTSIS